MQLVDEENPDRDFYYSDDFNREGELSLELRDLVEGRTVSRYPLAFVKYQRASQAIGQNAMHIAEAGDHILVGYGNTIYKLKLNPEEVADLKEPLTINKEIQPRTATVGEVVQIPVTARGGEGDITFRLTQDVDGLSIDAASGVLSIDTTKLWRNWLATDDYERTYLTRFDRDDGLSAAQESYENVFGESIEEIPFRVPFEVVAADSQGMSTRLSNQLVVLAPMAEWNALIKAREEEWERERARAAAERERLAAERAKAKAMEPGSASSAEISAVGDVIDDSLGQIAALSEQLKEMQAVLDDAKESSRADGEVSPAIQAKLDDVDEQLGEIQASLTERDQSNSNQVLFLLVLFVVVTVLAVAGGAIIAMIRRSKL